MNVWCDAAENTLGSCNGHFLGADGIIVSPDEGRTGSDLAPEVSGDHMCRGTAVGAINPNTSLAKIKAIIRVFIIVLVNTVPENEMLCESWFCLFVVYCIAVWPSFCENSKTVHACELSACFCSASVFSPFEKVGGLSGVGFFSLMGLCSPSPRLWEFSHTAVGTCLVEKKMLTVMAMVCIHGFESDIY